MTNGALCIGNKCNRLQVSSAGFGSFDNSMCKRVLDLLEPGDLRLGQVVIESCRPTIQAWSEQ